MYLNSGKTEDVFVAACARNMWLAAALFDVQLLYKHVPGKQNTAADLLSRWRNTQSNACPVRFNSKSIVDSY